jgi:capsular polysaccharide biosynthesis protein/predicted Ser/Thr protein kinase
MAAAAVSTEAGHTGGQRPEPPSLERLAAAFPQLEVIEFIGQGGMGAVYKARQKQLDRIVALKVLPPGIGGDPAFAERFTREAKALAKLLHPNIVALFEFGQADGIYYLLMEFVDGVSLGQLLRASRVSAREALAIVPQICDALQYAHDQGIVHRDIKPENILLDRRGRVKVADFGLAKLMDANAPLTPSLSPSDGERVAAKPGEGKTPALTDAGRVMGTPAYMAPEQVEHPADVDHRADIYALGVVFYQMLTGELPGKRIEAPSKKVQIDVRLDEVVLRALEKDPGRRYSQASVLKTQVETIATDMRSATAPPTGTSAKGGAGEATTLCAIKKKKGEFIGVGCAIQALGIACFFIPPVGWILGVILLLLGGRMALKVLCSHCGNPTTREARICTTCGAHFLPKGASAPSTGQAGGIISSSESARPGVQVGAAGGRDYCARQTLFGLPLVHVAWGIDPATGRPRVAKGIVAVGPAAFGVIAVGFSAWGLFPCGLVAVGFGPVGLFAVGFWTVGLAAVGVQAVGLWALASWHAIGLVAVGPSPIGLERMVVEKGTVGLLFVVAIVAALFMDRLIRAIGSAPASANFDSSGREEARTQRGIPGERRSLRWAWAAVAAAVVWCLTLLAVACLTFFVLPESFKSTARVKTGHAPDRNLLQAESELIKSEVILGSVIEDLKLKEAWGRRYNGGRMLTVKQTLELLRPCVELSSVRNTGLIEIHVFRERPDEAASIANAIAEAYRQHRANQSAQLSHGLEKSLKDQLEAANGKIAAARQELDKLQKASDIGEAAAQLSRDPVLAEAKERPFWQKKRDLEDLLRFRNELASQVLSQSMGNVIPRAMSVEIVDRAVPALHPARPNKPLNLVLGAAAGGVLGLLAGGLVLLFGSRRVRPGGAVLPSASN